MSNSDRVLKNKPLIEAVFELRWALTSSGPSPEFKTDPYYRLHVGRFAEHVGSTYPEYERLPTASVPDDFAGYMVQHRFRTGPDEWPLLQIGPGILTVNETDTYTWTRFKRLVTDAVSQLLATYPRPAELKPESLVLRYINAVEFDYTNSNIMHFLSQMLKIEMKLPTVLFEQVHVNQAPAQFSWQTLFRCDRPTGHIILRFSTGQKQGRPALLWETLVQTVGVDVPDVIARLDEWLDEAHELILDWFFKLIEGKLEKRFSNG